MTKENYLNDLSEIKELMNKSTRFVSLSGMSGIMAGIYALIGAAIGYLKIQSYNSEYVKVDTGLFYFILIDLILVALLSVATAVYLTYKKADKNKQSMWNATTKRLLFHFLVPLVTGGIFIIIKLIQHRYGQTGSLMLLFYGLALVNASKFTFSNIKYLGIAEIILGLIGALYPGYGFWLWVIGFGVLHIIYGVFMYVMHGK